MNTAFFLLMGPIIAFLLYLIYRAFAKGEATFKHGTSKRSENPVGYWLNTLFLIMLTVVFLWAFVTAAWSVFRTGHM